MARVTPTEVGEIVAVKATIGVDPFIDVANNMVDDVCLDSGYTDAKLKLIELWLSAHFYAVRDPRVDMEKAGSVSQKFQYEVDLNLAVTVYGQQAMVIDTDGNLAKVNKQATTGNATLKKVGVVWAGTDPSP